MAALTLGHSPRAPSLAKYQTFQVTHDKTTLNYWQFLGFSESAQLCIENSEAVGVALVFESVKPIFKASQ